MPSFGELVPEGCEIVFPDIDDEMDELYVYAVTKSGRTQKKIIEGGDEFWKEIASDYERYQQEKKAERQTKLDYDGKKAKRVICRTRDCVHNTGRNKCLLSVIELDDNGICRNNIRIERDRYIPVNHLNYFMKNGVYCRRMHEIVNTLDGCRSGCDLLAGSLQGDGVECYWKDVVDSLFYVHDPQKEFNRVDSLIKKGVLDRTALRVEF
jgi:hypothetical protein